jgi:hypothetical protein
MHAAAGTRARRPAQVYYTPNGNATLLQAIQAHYDPGTDYYFTVNGPASHKTQVRQSAVYDNMRVLPNVHPVAEFNLAAWKKLPGTWFQKGVEFRKQMIASGLRADDMWAINEAGSGIRTNGVARRHLTDLVRGLYRAGGTLPRAQGIVFQQGPGYSQGLHGWHSDRRFWGALKNRVRYYMNETYASPGSYDTWKPPRQTHYLLGGTQGLPKSHPLHGLYAPMMSAYWDSITNAYGNTKIRLSDMQRFVRSQSHMMKQHGQDVYGFAWNEHPIDVHPADLQALASTLVSPFAASPAAGAPRNH